MIVADDYEDMHLITKILDETNAACKWGYLMGRPICGCGWSAITDWPQGSGYVDQTPYLVFLNHVKDKHGLDVKPHKQLNKQSIDIT